MKTLLHCLSAGMFAATVVVAQTEVTWTNKITQTTLPSGPTTYLPGVIGESGKQSATISLKLSDPGLKFQLYTVPSNLDQNQPYLLQTTSVGRFPTGVLEIDTEDPYNKADPGTGEPPNVTYENPTFPSAGIMPRTNPNGVGRRTRADRPFRIYSKTDGIDPGPTADPLVKSINFYRLIKVGAAGSMSAPQPGVSEVGSALSPITSPGIREHFPSPASRGSNPRKYIGVEQFSLWSLADNPDPNLPGQKLCSAKVEIYPLCDGTISGIAMDEKVRFAMPKLTIVYHDVYPGPINSAVYAQIYKGERRNVVGSFVPGTQRNNLSTSLNEYTEFATGEDLDRLIDTDGRWTIELLSNTPFGIERMLTASGQPAYVTFSVDRTIEVNGTTVTTIE